MKERSKDCDASGSRHEGGSQAAPVRSGATWRQRWREFRFLAIILSVWVGLGLYEMTRKDLPKSPADVPPDWLLDEQVNISKTLLELYPNRSFGHFLRGYQAGMCWEQNFMLPVCATFPHKNELDVRDALQAALERGGARNQEELFHFYAFILAQLNEPPEKVDEAVQQWRRHYPYSRKPDPRDMPKVTKAP